MNLSRIWYLDAPINEFLINTIYNWLETPSLPVRHEITEKLTENIYKVPLRSFSSDTSPGFPKYKSRTLAS